MEKVAAIDVVSKLKKKVNKTTFTIIKTIKFHGSLNVNEIDEIN